MTKKVKDLGLGYRTFKNAKKLINRDGTSNVIHLNRTFGMYDLYSYLIEVSWRKFFLFVIATYILANIFFAIVYYFIGIEQITPTTGNTLSDLLNGFFFSAQTITTVGYGGISPQGTAANMIASFEAMIGLLGFSFVTGLDDKINDYQRKFYQLKLERDQMMYLPAMWTIVHELDQESPLSIFSDAELQDLNAELYILLEYHTMKLFLKNFLRYIPVSSPN